MVRPEFTEVTRDRRSYRTKSASSSKKLKRHTEEEITKDLDRWIQYIDVSSKLATELSHTKSDIDAQRELLIQNAKEDWITAIIQEVQYDWAVQALSQKIIDMYPEEVASGELRVAPQKKARKKRIAQSWKRTHKTSYVKGGRTISYKRGYKRWTAQEEMYLMNRPEEPGKKLRLSFREFFGYERSNQSLLKKRERLSLYGR